MDKAFMEADALQSLRRANSAWRLLAADDAPFCCAFFYQEFIAENRRNIPEEAVLHDLQAFLYQYGGAEKREEENLEREAQERLKVWANDDHQWLRRFTRDRMICYDLTASAQKAVEWLWSLRERKFIGTESRLHLFFHLLHEIEHDANPDREARIAFLEARKKEINEELKMLRQGGAVQVLTDVQIKERFLNAMDIGESILSDFRAVKDRFQEMYEKFRKEVNEWDEGKGKLIDLCLDNQKMVEESEQGKSFTAFFNYLMQSDESDRDFDETVRKVLLLGNLSQMAKASDIRHIKYAWTSGAEDVQETADKITAQISWYVNEKHLEEKRNIYCLIRDIQEKAAALRGRIPKREAFMMLDEGAADVDLPMDTPLTMPPAEIRLAAPPLTEGTHHGESGALFHQIYVKKEELARRVEAMLAEKSPVSLAEVTARYPLRYGLLELLSYLELEKKFKVERTGTIDRIPYASLSGRPVYTEMERVLFSKKRNAT